MPPTHRTIFRLGSVFIRVHLQLITVLWLVLQCALTLAQPSDKTPDFIRVAPDGFSFQDATGQRFIPMGAIYFDERHGQIDPMNWWGSFNEEHVRRDFALARRLGCNTLRIIFYLTPPAAGSFATTCGTDEDWRKCDTIVRLARENQLRLYAGLRVTGRSLVETPNVPLYAAAWSQAARRYRDEPAILCWELDAENTTLIGYPGDRERWLEWLKGQYPTDEANAKAWGRSPADPQWRDAVWDEFTKAIHHSGEFDPARKVKPELNYLDSANKPDDPALYDWQRFRDYVYTEKMRALTDAVRRADPNHLVTVDLILYAFPLFRNPGPAGWGGPYGYAGVDVRALGKFVDFIGFHGYPMYLPPYTTEYYEELSRDPKIFERELRYVETACRFIHAMSGRPVVLSEVGWHGGPGDWHGLTEEDQRRWCEAAIERTRHCAIGWLNWALRDVPTHESITRSSGLVATAIRTKPDNDKVNPLSDQLYTGDLPDAEADRVKAWGRAFGPLAAAAQHDPERRFVPGKRLTLSRKQVYTTGLRPLDGLLQQAMSDANYPCDIVLE